MEEATKRALTQLNVGLDDVEITVLSEGRGGILGIGAEDARIRVTLLEPPPGNRVDTIDDDAVDILSGLVAKMGIKADITVEKNSVLVQNDDGEDHLVLNVSGEDADLLIGRKGQTLEALQYIARLMLVRKTGSQISLTIDAENYRRRRYEDLRTLARNVADQVRQNKTSIRLEPMSPYDRRIVHMALADDPDVSTESIGEGETRKVVILPKKRA